MEHELFTWRRRLLAFPSLLHAAFVASIRRLIVRLGGKTGREVVKVHPSAGGIVWILVALPVTKLL